MLRTLPALAAASALALAGSAAAQPSGGPGAKGNAPLKAPHTVNDGAAKKGANSFTEAQARKHILNAGYSAVSRLTKGSDGVWRGVATKDGASRNVALDFKGNVAEGGPNAQPPGKAPAGAMEPAGAGSPAPRRNDTSATGAAATGTSGGTLADAGGGSGAHVHAVRHRRHHPARVGRCANPSPNGAACSGVDKNHNGISDKEDRAISKGAHP